MIKPGTFYFIQVLFLLLSLHTKGTEKAIRFHYLGTENGLTQASVNAICQDNHGFIWLGTQDGLNRFDGYDTKAYKSNRSDRFSLTSNDITGLCASSDNKLWIAHDQGLSYMDLTTERFRECQPNKGKLNLRFLSANGYRVAFLCKGKGAGIFDSRNPEKTLRFLASDDSLVQACWMDNQLLLLSAEGKIYCYKTTEKKLQVCHPFSMISHPKLFAINRNKNKVAFITDKECILTDTKGHIVNHFTTGISSAEKPGSMQFINDSLLWIACRNSLYSVNINSRITQMVVPAQGSIITFYQNSIHNLFRDYSGSIWVGTDNGLLYADPSNQCFDFVELKSNDNRSGSSLLAWSAAYFNDEIWMGTSQGIFAESTDKKKKIQIPVFINGRNQAVYSLLANGNKLLAGTDDGVIEFKESSKAFVTAGFCRYKQEWFASNRIYHLLQHQNTLWIASRRGLLLVDAHHQNTILAEIPLPYAARQVLITPDKRIFIATDGNGIIELGKKKDNSYSITPFPSGMSDAERRASSVILSLAYVNGQLYAGTFGAGLLTFDLSKNTCTRVFTETEGLSNNSVNAIITGDRNTLWLSTNKGINNYNTENGKCRWYNTEDGLLCSEYNAGAGLRAPQGNILFGGIGGFTTFNPSLLLSNTIPPRVCMTSLRLLNKPVTLSERKKIFDVFPYTDTLNFNFRERYFTIAFTANHYSSPHKNKFRYMLKGWNDDEWIETEYENKAVFNNIEPGDYLFMVEACNSSGMYSSQPATLYIHIQPPFWKTIWFKLLLIVSTIGLFIAYNRARVKAVTKQKKLLEELVDKRTEELLVQSEELMKRGEELEKEKNRTEKLLLNILPFDTAEELKTKGKASARSYRQASILFTDFAGFTAVSQTMRPSELVYELDECFREMDRIIEKYDLEKIKTIGDSYMCVGGVPVRNISNPFDSVLAGLAIMDYIHRRNNKRILDGKIPWKMRLGIHTGEIVAGVIGSKRLAYDVWGPSVNIAKRMESAAEPGTVNISETTYLLVKDFFDCTPRGALDAKHMGPTEMYLVNGLKPEYRENESLFVPNSLYTERLNHLLYSKFNYKKMEKHIIDMLQNNLSPDYEYHSLKHTFDVRDMSELIGKAEGLGREEIFLLKTAALYHDAGFLIRYENNEEAGAELAKKYLPRFGYSQYHVDMICRLILATKMNTRVTDLLEMIICDADLDYLGRADFPEISEKLKRELLTIGKIKNDKDWDQLQVTFLERHSYYTTWSVQNRNAFKQQQLAIIKKRLSSYP